MSDKVVQKFSWSREATAELIEVYRKRECMYDFKSPAYFNREKHRETLQEMVTVVAKYHPEVTETDCKKKIHGLRTQFTREYTKILKSKKNGAGTNETYSPKLWCFNNLVFLKNFVQVKRRNIIGGMDEDPEDSAEEMLVEVLEENAEDYIQYAGESSSATVSEIDSFNSVSTYLKPKIDDLEEKSVFSLFIEERLRKLNPINRLKTEHEILNVILKYEMKQSGLD